MVCCLTVPTVDKAKFTHYFNKWRSEWNTDVIKMRVPRSTRTLNSQFSYCRSFAAYVAPVLNSNILTLHYLKGQLRNGDASLLMVLKFWGQEEFIALKIETLFTETTPFLFTQLSETKFRCRTTWFHRWNGWCRSVGRRKTIIVSWLLKVVDTADRMIHFAFIHNFKYSKVARAVGSRYAENFCPQTWSHGSRNRFEKIH